MRLHRIKLSASKLDVEDLRQALRIIQESKGPILVHCWHGSDRTGAVVAAYRIVFQHWSMEAAADELLHGDYGFHKTYDNIPELIQKVDWESLKREFKTAR